MKTSYPFIIPFVAAIILFASSCRKEEFAFVGTAPDQTLLAGSAVVTQLQNIALNDGSADNIIDQASCLSIKLPINVLLNGVSITINTPEDYDTIEDIYDEMDDDDDTLEIVFPITVISEDFSETVVSDSTELENLRDTCPEENGEDADNECVDIKYPISISSFNPNTEVTQSISVLNDNMLLNFLSNIRDDDVVTIAFPVTLILSDGTETMVGDLLGLENAINDAGNDCDEDDDFYYHDDDCDDCTVEELSTIWSGCTDWVVERLVRDNANMSGNYTGLTFNFLEDGTAVAISNTDTFVGTWSAVGSGNDIDMVIDIPGLNDLNATWQLNEIALDTNASVVNLRIGEENVLLFANSCANGNAAGTNTDSTLENGSWQVSSFVNDGTDETSDFTGVSLTFGANDVVTADNGAPVNGTWTIQNANTQLLLDFGSALLFDRLNNDWRFVAVTDTQVELKHIGTGGDTATLILTQQ